MTGNVFRVNKTRDYTVMSNHHLRNRNLSLKAKGLLSLMLSLPPEWDYSANGLATLLPDGRDGVQAALRELEKHGYLQRTQTRDALGKISGVIYDIYETPCFQPKTDLPSTANPKTANPPQLNTKESNTDLISSPIQERVNKEVYSPMRVCGEKTRTKKPKAIPPSVEEVEAYCNERGNGINAQYFCDYYATRAWKLKSGPMKDWKAAIRTWEHNGIDTGRTAQQHRKSGNDELLDLIRSGAFDQSEEEVAYTRQRERETAERMEMARAFMQGGKT